MASDSGAHADALSHSGTLPRRRGRFLGVVAATFAACMVLSVALPHDPYIRYQSFKGTIFDRLSWVYDRLYHDDTPIDVLFIGSSRTARGANAAAIEAELAEIGRPELRVANISEPASGMDIRLTKLRDALRAHPEIRLVVLGMVEALPRDGHQAFGDLATAGQVLTAPWVINRTLPENLAALPFRQIELALASRLPDAFGYRAAFDPDAYPGPTPDHRDFNDANWREIEAAKLSSAPRHAAELAAESVMRRREITPPVLPDALAWAEFGVSRSYLQDMAGLLEDEGVEMAFVFLPFYDGYDEPLDADYLRSVAPIWSAAFMRETPMNYFDAAHASQHGIELLAPWFARRIADTLEPAR
ncbi:hypothetical protein G5B39_18505 (plasmid) [Rhodobacteraceae bacterium SC52]|nr:hypothetical protein G5B39_18505 [Rhodobacteraceae bacterium SC52]